MFKPDKLFSYEPSEDCRLDSILENKLYLSKPANFNDVSECTCQIELMDKSNIPNGRLIEAILSIYDRTFDEVKHNFLLDESIHTYMIDVLKNELLGTQSDILRRIIKRVGGTLIKCFIPLGNNNVMWSHYGKNYSGISIEFENNYSILNSQFTFIESVSYQNQRPCFSLIDALFKPQIVFEELLLTKQADWSYERETRLCVFSGEEYLSSDNGKLINLPKNLRVLSVTFGTHCSFDYIYKYAQKLIGKGIDCYYLVNYSDQQKLNDIDFINGGENLRTIVNKKSKALSIYP